MPKHTFYLVTYDRGLHPLTHAPKTHHWAYFLELDAATAPEPTGVIFQLRGMPGGFYYPGPEEDMGISQIGAPGELRERLEIGEVDVKDQGGISGVVDKIDAVLKKVGVVKDEGAAWNCQDWAMGGLEGLKMLRVVYESLNEEGIKGWLRER
ncbi:hypothetical protein NEMBOFW57_009671 [Staphylotrichum longicolle]|uniref:Uncharacterized protein n=1 Tax=Staphylotrichum longicolle TaxID=669026 RepID=A0AAD4EPS0_9PEZI|nr:hypothetical protein NEMBOFW57_009671 [Staphylotrichum longicolle]